jgi:hypothetical protein
MMAGPVDKSAVDKLISEGYNNIEEGDSDPGFECFSKALAMDPGNADARKGMIKARMEDATWHIDENEFEEALETANIPPLFKRWSGGMFRTVKDPQVF